jgi:molecular chaperone GrpE
MNSDAFSRNSRSAPASEAATQRASDTDALAEELGDEVLESEQEEPTTGAAEHEPEDHEQKLERDLDELTAKAEKADEYLELAKRTKADFENYRKRAARESGLAQERGVVKLAKELLPAVDNLDRALAAAEAAGSGATEDGDGTLISGVKLVHDDVIAALARVGIEPYSPQGEQFDPQRHEAVAQQPVEGTEPGTIVEVYQRGYRLGESVLRPARVVVAG